MDHKASIGARVKALRTSKKLTLKQLSELSGLSIGFLSQLERGLSSIAIDSLAKLADILDVSLSAFFDTEQHTDISPVCRNYALHGSQVAPQIIQYLPNGQASGFICLPRLFDLMPNDEADLRDLAMNQHEGEEYIYVIEGILTVYLNGSKYSLNPGDSVQIHSDHPHAWVNETNRVVRILVINAPNPFSQGAGLVL
ncbi:MAG: cupin domain-containing protein [Clostridium sp.]|nr:cupin domain-containing protein [Clostridium sp.]